MREGHGAHFGSTQRGSLHPKLGCVALTLLLCAACGVDDRTLSSGETGGLNSQGGGSSSDSSDGGSAGAKPVPVCVYSGSVVAEGCDTLVSNPGFALNVADWVAEPVGVTEGWVQADASGDEDSGSLVVTNTNYSDEDDAKAGVAGGGARQCLPINGGSAYDFTADIFIPEGQGAGFQGKNYTSTAMLSVFFYSSPGCQGQTVSNFTSKAVQEVGKWIHVEGMPDAPKGTQSMAVRLATLKPFPQVMFQAEFDNVFVRER